MPTPGFEVHEEAGEAGTLRLRVCGRIDLANAQEVLETIAARLEPSRRPRLVLDLTGVEYFDSGGGAVLIGLRQRVTHMGGQLDIARATPAIDGFRSLVDEAALLHPRHLEHHAPPGFVMRAGEATLEMLANVKQLVIFTGELVLGVVDAVLHPRRLRGRDVWLYMQRCGIDGLPIIALISFLMGLITAFQAAVQLTYVGADIYVANLVALSVTRELGPLMTAVIASGRSGAAFAAEIGTMKVAEEVDALTTMGLDRTRFLVTPKVLAMIFMVPCLTLFADVIGILGGVVVGVFGLNLPLQVYMRQTRIAMRLWDVYSGLMKSVVFAVLIAAIGCLRGFQAQTGAESVGRVTTSAIVAGIFLIVVADAVFTVIFYYW